LNYREGTGYYFDCRYQTLKKLIENLQSTLLPNPSWDAYRKDLNNHTVQIREKCSEKMPLLGITVTKKCFIFGRLKLG
jgi:hypothetical protein